MMSLAKKIQQHKLPISFLLIIALFVFFEFLTIKGLITLGNPTRTIYEHPLIVSNASLHAALNMTKIHCKMKDIALANSFEEIKHILNAVAESEQKVYRQLDIIRKDILGEEGKELEKQTRQLFEHWKPIREKEVELLVSGHKQQDIIAKKNESGHVEKLEGKMLELTSYAMKKADFFLKVAEESHSTLKKITIILTIIGGIISIIIACVATNLVLKTEILLRNKNKVLQKSIDEIKTLRGILPICSFCKNIRNDQGYYEQIEGYIHNNSGVDFSHTICPLCVKKHYPKEYKNIL